MSILLLSIFPTFGWLLVYYDTAELELLRGDCHNPRTRQYRSSVDRLALDFLGLLSVAIATDVRVVTLTDRLTCS